VINEQLMNETQISQSFSGAIFPHITLDDADKVYICWQDNRTGHYNIFYRRSASITSVDEIFLELYE
jgi:hypothetical protein